MKDRKKSTSVLRDLLERLKRLLRPKGEPEDPYAYVTAPLPRLPRDRSGTAVAELDEE